VVPVFMSAAAQSLSPTMQPSRDMAYRFDVVLERPRYCLCMFCALFRNRGQVADLVSVVLVEVFQGVFKVKSDI
jgi:hypothetical protein